MKQKTPIQELIDEMQKSPLMFASSLTLIDQMRMLEKEKEDRRKVFSIGYRMKTLFFDKVSINEIFDITFNTEER